MNEELEALERGILEFEKELEYDCNNEWLKRVVVGMKKCYQRLEAIENTNSSEALKSLEFICKILKEKSIDIKWLFTNDYNTIKQALLKAQENEEENAVVVGGRTFNKEIVCLKECVEKYNDKPILYINRTYGNKYIIPQKQLDDLTNENIKYKKIIDELKSLMEKFDIESVEELEEIVQDGMGVCFDLSSI